jgi:hypothetical protein
MQDSQETKILQVKQELKETKEINITLASQTLNLSLETQQKLTEQSDIIHNIQENNNKITIQVSHTNTILNKMLSYATKVKEYVNTKISTKISKKEKIKEKEIKVITLNKEQQDQKVYQEQLDELLRITLELKQVNLNISKLLDDQNVDLTNLDETIEDNIENMNKANLKIKKLLC